MPKEYFVLHAGQVVYKPGHYDKDGAETFARSSLQRDPSGTYIVVKIESKFGPFPPREEKLNKPDREILSLFAASHEEQGFRFVDVSNFSGYSIKQVKASCRKLKRMGLLSLGPFYELDENRLVGSGYFITALGKEKAASEKAA